MTATATKLDVRLLLQVERRRFADDDSLDVYAYPVHIINDDGQEKIRNFSGSFADDRPELADLRISAYYSPGAEEPLWGWTLAYRHVFQVEEADAERMLKLLRKLRKGYERSCQQLGAPESYPAFVARFATVLGISQYGFKASGDSPWMDGNRYRWCDASNLAGYLDHQLRTATEGHGARARGD